MSSEPFSSSADAATAGNVVFPISSDVCDEPSAPASSAAPAASSSMSAIPSHGEVASPAPAAAAATGAALTQSGGEFIPFVEEPPRQEGRVYNSNAMRKAKCRFYSAQLEGTTYWGAKTAAAQRKEKLLEEKRRRQQQQQQQEKSKEQSGGDQKSETAEAAAKEALAADEEKKQNQKDNMKTKKGSDDDDDDEEDVAAALLVPPKQISRGAALRLWQELIDANVPDMVVDGRRFTTHRCAHEMLKLDEYSVFGWVWLALTILGADYAAVALSASSCDSSGDGVVCASSSSSPAEKDPQAQRSMRVERSKLQTAPPDIAARRLRQLPGGAAANKGKFVVKMLNFKDSMLQALLCSEGDRQWDWLAWQEAGVILSETESDFLTYRGRTWRSEDCFRTACELITAAEPPLISKSEQAKFWHTIGDHSPSGVIRHRGEVLSPLDCIRRSLEIDPQRGVAWMRLAELMQPDETVLVNSVSYSRVAASVQGVLMSGSSESYTALGHYQNVDLVSVVYIEGKGYSMKDCFARACELDSKSAWSHNNLGFALSVDSDTPDVPCLTATVEVRGRKLNCLDAYIRALTLGSDSVFWSNIAEALVAHPNHTLMIHGFDYQARDLKVDLDPVILGDLAPPNPRRTQICRSFD